MQLAVIPARGGSKRIPGKNIREFCGKPIIEYSIEACLQSGCFEKVMVSTDDPDIAEYALNVGAEVPYYRSKENSDDYATTADVMSEVLDYYKQEGQHFEYACCIYATAPFIQAQSIQQAFQLLTQDKSTDAVFPVTRFSFPIQRAIRLNQSNQLSMFEPDKEKVRSQDLEPAYHDAGQFYWLRVDDFKANQSMWGKNGRCIVLPNRLAQDIDEEEDWLIAEMKYQIIHAGTSTLSIKAHIDVSI